MKRICNYIVAACICILLNACQKELLIAVNDVTLNTESISLLVGTDETSLIATVSPSNATNKNIIWTSSDSNIAKVTNGVVSAVNPGTATIKVKTEDGGKIAECRVTVLSEIIHVSGLKLKNEEGAKLEQLSLLKGGKASIVAAVEPGNATDKTVRWKSSNESIVTVSEKGEVNALNPGNAVVIATTVDGAYTATCKIEISSPAARILLDTTKLVLNEYESYMLKTKVEPEDYDSELVWSSSDEALVKVYNGMLNAGKMKETGESKAVITVCSKTDSKVKAQCEVTVVSKVAGVRFEYPEMYVKEGESIKALINVYPKRALNRKVTISSKDENTVTVKNISSGDRIEGEITGVKPGETLVEAKTEDGNFTAQTIIHVFSRVDGISLDQTKMNLNIKGDKNGKQLKATITPPQATKPDIRWKSSNADIVTVDENGMVKPVSTGDATVIASTVDGGLIASCEVKVISTLERISFAKQGEIEIYEGASMNLDMKYEPEDATDKELLWESSDTTIVRAVNGTLISMKGGKATIKAYAKNNPDVKAECKVNVISKITGVTLDKNEMTLKKDGSYKLTATVSPAGAPEKDKVLEWISSNEEVAKVSADGTVTALQSGNATITTYTRNREFSASCYITVINPITSFKLKTHNGESGVFENETIQIDVAEVMPSDADETEFEWESSDMSAATVDKHGNVTGKVSSSKDCKVIITAKSKTYPDVKATITLNIFAHVKEVHFEPAELTLNSGGGSYSAKTILKVLPEWAKVQEMESVTPENTDLIVVNKGKTAGEYNVLALPNITGKTRIVAVSKDGAIKGYCNVTVIDKVLVEDIVLNRTNVNLKEGENVKVTARATPSNATNPELKWSSKDEKIASVAQDGTISGIKAGNTEIYVESTDGTKIKKTIPVKVDKAEIKVTDITLSQSSVTLKEGESAKVTATVIPSDATNPTLKWSSKDGTIASVTQDGTISGRKAGNTEIYVEATDGSGIKKTIPVTVNSTEIKVTGITLSQSSVTLKEGESAKVTATVIPSDATNPTLKWSSKDGTIASVTQDGTISGRKAGNTEIYVESTDGSGIKKTIPITVEKTQVIHVTSVTLNETSIKIEKGKTFDLVATVNPEDAENKTVTWTVSSGNGIISINPSGAKCTVSGNQNGKAEVTVTSVDGGHTARCSVEVGEVIHVKTITLDKNEIELTIRESKSIFATIEPSDATIKDIETSIPTSFVDQISAKVVGQKDNIVEIRLTGLSETKYGKARVVVKSKDVSDYTPSATCLISVKKVEVESVSLDRTSLTLKEGRSTTLTATIHPDNSSDKSVKWSSSNKTIATVDENGKVTAVKAGKAIIKATANDGGKFANCEIRVTSSIVDGGATEGLEYEDLN